VNEIIKRVYNYSEHKSSDKPNSISATGLLGSLYQGKLTLAKAERDDSLIADKFKRSSTLGSAFHAWAEKALQDDPNIHCEIYSEIDYDNYVLSGSCDVLQYNADTSKWTIMDFKTGYGKKRTDDQLDKDMKQMSIYRWMLQDRYYIEDTAYSLFISQSNNEQEAYELELMSLEKTQEFIDDRLFAIDQNTRVDCFDAKYIPCNYCDKVCEHRK